MLTDYSTIFRDEIFSLIMLITKGFWSQISSKKGCICNSKSCIGRSEIQACPRKKPFLESFFITLEKSFNLLVPVFCLVNVLFVYRWDSSRKDWELLYKLISIQQMLGLANSVCWGLFLLQINSEPRPIRLHPKIPTEKKFINIYI